MADESRSNPPPHETYRTSQTLAAGQLVLERYTLRKFLGRGGFGVVWLAHDEELELEVAIKFLSDLIVNNPEAVADLKRETRHSLRLTHPNIVRIHGFLQGPQIAGISMEFVDGGTMSGLKADRPQRCFNSSELAPLITQLIDALDYAHTRGQIVHRDLKPGNLMLNSGGELKVADFGISRSISDTHTRLSEASPTSGTPAYMSPQQMMGQSPRVTDDIYSLGATIYDLLAGKPPFYTGDVPSQVLRVTAPPIEQRRQELEIEGAEPVSPEWEKALATCLAKAPESRPQNVREVAALLGLAVPSRPLADARPPSMGDAASGLPGDGADSGRPSQGTGSATRSRASAVSPPPTGVSNPTGSGSHTPAGAWAQETPPARKNLLPLILAGVSVVALVVSGILVMNRPKAPAVAGGGATTATPAAPGSGSVSPPSEAPTRATTSSSDAAPPPTTSPAVVPPPAQNAEAVASEDAKMARLVDLSESIPELIARRRWDQALREIEELRGIDPRLPQLGVWQAELDAGRNAERGQTLRESVQRALSARQWDRAESDNEQLLAVLPGDPQGIAWRIAIAAGRQAESRNTAPPATTPPPGQESPPAATNPAVSDEQAIRSVVASYARSQEALDIERYSALWRSFSPGERSKLAQAFDHVRSQTVEVEIESIEAAGTSATVGGQEHRQVQMKQGSPQSIDLKVTIVLEKSGDGRWQIIERKFR